jgi:glycosyltransferase involved in cell wall biosynthesis
MKKEDLIGVVVIGRNEGERLNDCFNSLRQELNYIVYVDSGSTDNSVDIAEQHQVIVVRLDMSIPFTAARARNEGFKTLINQLPELKYAHFIDGDCQIVSGWLDAALSFLESNETYAVACGRRRERFPERTLYNRLCEIEWNTPTGDATACGGDALFRISALNEAKGYRNDLIAGEEPELCFRLREKGWKIRRLDHDMTLHDANMTHFRQWWQRTKRAGFAYAAGSHLHGKSPERYWVKETRSIIFWGGFLPIASLILTFFVSPWFLCLWLIYPAQIAKIAFIYPVDKSSRRFSLIYAFSVMLAKFPQISGVGRFLKTQLFSEKAKLIEYK